jgi:ribosomal-protein-alanine N-acetyltransferase
MPMLVTPALPAGALRDLDQPTLTVDGRRLTLRPWHDGDAGHVRAAFDGADIQRWHVRRMDTDDEARVWISSWERRYAAESDASWAIVDDADEPVGQVGLRTIALFEATAQLSYWVVPAARGAGTAASAVDALTRWAFGVVGFHRLFLQHSTANAASCRVADRAGCRYEGTLRRALRHADGWHDVHVHARLAEDG